MDRWKFFGMIGGAERMEIEDEDKDARCKGRRSEEEEDG